jgi:hypothetical protein
MAVLLILGLISKPLQLHLLSNEERLLYDASLSYSSKRCSTWQQIKNFKQSICELNGIDNHYKNVLLVGDSHAGAIRHALSSTAERYGYNTFLTKKNSALTKGELTVEELLIDISANNINSVIFHYATQNLIKDNEFLLHKIIALSQTLRDKGIRVHFIMPTPQFDGKQPLKEIYHNIKTNMPLSSLSLNDYHQTNSGVMVFLDANLGVVKKYDSADLFCEKNCMMVDELHQPVYVDAGHLTKTGARKLTPVFNKIFLDISHGSTK